MNFVPYTLLFLFAILLGLHLLYEAHRTDP